MHIAEGVLSAPVLAVGAAASAAGVAIGLRTLRNEDIPRAALLSSVFFVASLIHVPIGLTSVHLVMHALVGLVLGWAAFPVILVGLLLQAQLFGFGGITALGVNTLIMAGPAVACHYLFRHTLATAKPGGMLLTGFVAAPTAVALSTVLIVIALTASGREFIGIAGLIAVSHIPVLIIEAIVTGVSVGFLQRVCPQLLQASELYRKLQPQNAA